MVVGALRRHSGDIRKMFTALFIVMMLALSPLLYFEKNIDTIEGLEIMSNTSDSTSEVWMDGDQPWPQFGRTSDRIGDVPTHSPSGGAGFDIPINATELLSVIDPEINWQLEGYDIGTDSLATPIGDFKNSITKSLEAEERCGNSSLFIIIIQTEDFGGTDHSILKIIEGEDADVAWQVDLGPTEKIKTSPGIVDIDEDGKQEIIVAYDAGGSVFVEVWSPRLTCSVTGWSVNGHSSELLWTWSDEDLRITSNEGPYTSNLFGGHNPTTQLLLADLDLDGDAELVLSLIDKITDDPVVLALPLPITNSPNPLWQVNLDKGSHPSDPAFAQTDDSTGYVLLTTIEANNGGMWVWKIESDTGDSSWDGGLSLNNLDGDNDVPHIRLPGPIITNLDSDDVPEMIITIPTDADGSAGADGAEYRGLEISDGDELWIFNAENGYADAPPTPLDTDGDGVYDRVCWVTWWQTTTARHGEVGCHDVGGSIPNQIWNRDLEQSSGTPNDEIAVSSVTWMDIDGEDEQDILVAFGRSLWAFDGEEGTSSAINTEWTNEIELDYRTWSSPSLADIDGDATLDIIIGNMVISTSKPDVRPLVDGRSIEFNPNAPEPGEVVTVTAFYENAGTVETDEGVDAILLADGVEIGRYRSENLKPVNPTDSGSFDSFDVEWIGGLGEHKFELRLDPYQNISQTRYDNDIQRKSLMIVPSYNASFEISTEPVRVTPGENIITKPTIRSTGRLAGSWSLTVDSSNLPEGWSWEADYNQITGVEIGVGEIWNPEITINAPIDALGSDSGFLTLELMLDSDSNISVSSTLPVEANRTRGLSLRGPDGTSFSEGYGLIGEKASAWLIIENVGNAQENQIAISWDSTNWGSNLELFNSEGVKENAIILDPGESKEMTAGLTVPNNANYGDSVSTPLTMCVGSGDEEICQTISLTFVASGVIVEINHQRSTPSNGLEWVMSADLPDDTGILNWSLVDSGMQKQEWNWTTSGQISIIANTISITGSPGSRVSGSIYLELPDNAPPKFHQFHDTDDSSNFNLKFSLEVLQIYRANLAVISPSEMPISAEIDEESVVMLRLENLGNGEDTYHLSHQLILNENITSDPGILVTFSNNPITLGAGSLRTIPITITIPESTPARVDIEIKIIMSSLGDLYVEDFEKIKLQAKQDHQWEINAYVNGLNLGQEIYTISTNEIFEVDVIAKNVGNMIDDLVLETYTEIILEEGDNSSGWSAIGGSKNDIQINETVSIKVNSTVPSGALVGSKMIVTIKAMSMDEEIDTFTYELGVNHEPGWKVSAEGTNLEIDNNGSEIELTIMQMGNKETRPYVSVWVVGENGWNIETPNEMPMIAPGMNAPLILNITPSNNSQYGNPVELYVKVREGDASAVSEVTLPLRVAEINDFKMISHGPWQISKDGGKSLIILENTGNSPTTISLEILSIPEGWELSGNNIIVISPGQKIGMPLEIIPSENWTGDIKTIRILAQNQQGKQKELLIETSYEEYSWSSSPVISVLIGDSAILNIHGTSVESTIVDENGNSLDWTGEGWLFPSLKSGFGNLTINQNSSLTYLMEIFQPISRNVSCQISGDLSNIQPSCSIESGNEIFDFLVLLIDDRGYSLDSYYGTLGVNSEEFSINLSSEEWDPSPGMRKLTIKIFDSYGRELASDEKYFEIRKYNWNIGLTSVALSGTGDNQIIEITAERFGHGQLIDADCKITLSSDDYQSIQKIDMSTRSILTPKPKFDRPLEIADGEEIVIKIECLFPWDIDSNPGDNEIRKVLTGGEVGEEEINIIESFMAAAVVILISSSLAWINKNRREMKEFEEMTRQKIQSKIDSEKNQKNTNKNEVIEDNEVSTENEANDEYIGIEEIQKTELKVEEEIEEEIEEEVLDDFERRLRRIRRNNR
ncbi:MAG: hypothetical protein CMB08_02690 [Euryarchaeota archaeon]|nr:hypothetical protein [Euryarchaeota archaeon]